MLVTRTDQTRDGQAGHIAPATQTAIDQRFMAAAIRFARRHEGLTGDNPSVAALVVQLCDGVPVIVGRGVTEKGGRPHAEVQALAQAGHRAKGACVYVTLEPCSHYGKTPPCANALIDAGIARVVVAADDPDSRVSGKGYGMLRAAGIDVVTGVLAEQAISGLAGYLRRKIDKRPHVTLKLALTSDGKMGLRSGEQIKITGPISNGQVQALRMLNDAILVGAGTVANDDPSLTCRLTGLMDRSPIRVVLDRRLTIPATSNLVRTADKVPVILATTSVKLRPDLADCAGLDILGLAGTTDAEQLQSLLFQLGEKGISTLLVEGGAKVAAAFLDAGLVDQLILFQSSCPLTADPESVHSEDQIVSAPILPEVAAKTFTLKNKLTFGNDVMYEYRVVR